MGILKAIARPWACRGDRAQKSSQDRTGAPEPSLGSVGPPRDPAALIDRLITALDLNRHGIPNQIYRDLSRICTSCNAKARCGFDLAAGCASKTYQAYCPSAHTLGTLRALQRSLERVSMK